MCASPDANITINDDIIGEDDETFKIVIIDAALPFNVAAGHPATIIINDNDSKCAVYSTMYNYLIYVCVYTCCILSSILYTHE